MQTDLPRRTVREAAVNPNDGCAFCVRRAAPKDQIGKKHTVRPANLRRSVTLLDWQLMLLRLRDVKDSTV